MICERNAIKKLALGALVLFALGALSVQAQERRAYRIVDKAGNVTYTHMPSADAKDAREAKKIDIKPAMQGRGGYTGSYSSYDDPRHYSNRPYYPGSYGSYGNYGNYGVTAQSAQSAQAQHQATLKAECERQRGTDCNNPAVLRLQDSNNIPRRGRY